MWEEGQGCSARPWDRHRTYAAGGFILHKQHGMGHVETSSPDDEAMIVLFRTGLVELSQNELRDE